MSSISLCRYVHVFPVFYDKTIIEEKKREKTPPRMAEFNCIFLTFLRLSEAQMYVSDDLIRFQSFCIVYPDGFKISPINFYGPSAVSRDVSAWSRVAIPSLKRVREGETSL